MMEASDNLRQWGLQRARAEEVGGGKRWAAEGVEWKDWNINGEDAKIAVWRA